MVAAPIVEAPVVEECTGILKLKLGACVSGPTYRMLEDLKKVSQLCNTTKNYMVRMWERWREDHPDFVPNTVTTKRGKEKEEDPALSYDCQEQLYASACKQFPVYTGIISKLRNEVLKRLKMPLPYNHEGTAKFRWQGIMAYEVSRDCYRASVIPVPNSCSVFCYDGACSRELSSGIMARVKKHAASCVVRFPLWAMSSGRKNKDVIARLEVADLPRGQRLVLKRIARGEWKFRDSQLVEKNGNWYLHLTYKQPKQDLGLPLDRIATLGLLAPSARRPMGIESVDNRWQLGDADILEREFKRFQGRITSLRERYRKRITGQTGHGHGRFYQRIRPANDLKRNLLIRFADRLISEIVKFCVRSECGKILYREPSLNLRVEPSLCWFAQRKIEFAWDKFRANLKHKCNLYGITLDVERIGCAEFRNASVKVVKQTPDTSCVSQPPTPKVVASNGNGTHKSVAPTNGHRSRQHSRLASKPTKPK